MSQAEPSVAQQVFGYLSNVFEGLSASLSEQPQAPAGSPVVDRGPAMVLTIVAGQNLGPDYRPRSTEYFSEIRCGEFQQKANCVEVDDVRIPRQGDVIQVLLHTREAGATKVLYQLQIPLQAVDQAGEPGIDKWFALDSPSRVLAGEPMRNYHAAVATATIDTVPKIRVSIASTGSTAQTGTLENQLRQQLAEKDRQIQTQHDELQQLTKQRAQGMAGKKQPYTAITNDHFDAHVAYYLKNHDDVWQNNKVVRKHPEIYEINGREVQLEWFYADPPEQGYLIVCDGPLRQPFKYYMEGTEEGAEYDETYGPQQSLHLIPREKRLSFGEQGQAQSRLEAMKLAKEQAQMRESAAHALRTGQDAPSMDRESYSTYTAPTGSFMTDEDQRHAQYMMQRPTASGPPAQTAPRYGVPPQPVGAYGAGPNYASVGYGAAYTSVPGQGGHHQGFGPSHYGSWPQSGQWGS